MRNICPQKLKGWLIGACDGKSQNEVGIQCIIFQLCLSFKLFSNSVKWGEGLTKALNCNGIFVPEFEHFKKTGGEWMVHQNLIKIFVVVISSTWKIFFTNRPTGLIPSSSRNVHISVYMFIYPLSI